LRRGIAGDVPPDAYEELDGYGWWAFGRDARPVQIAASIGQTAPLQDLDG